MLFLVGWARYGGPLSPRRLRVLGSTQLHVNQDHTGEPHQGCGEEDLPAPHEPQSAEVLCHQSCERKNVAEIGETDTNRIKPRDS